MRSTPQKPWSYGLSIPHDPRAVGIVRATLRSILRAARLDGLIDTAELLVSELATNAYRHSYGDAYVSMSWVPADFRVTVWDSSPVRPKPVYAAAGDEHGRGLALVSACADDWGIRDYADMGAGVAGKAVWFSLSP